MSSAEFSQVNALVCLAAVMAHKSGLRAGWGLDVEREGDDDSRTMVYIDLPTGQVCWHLTADDAGLARTMLPRYESAWDGQWYDIHQQRIVGFLRANMLDEIVLLPGGVAQKPDSHVLTADGRFQVRDGVFYDRQDSYRKVFEDRGGSLVSLAEEGGAPFASDMLRVAIGKGWTAVEVKGHDVFRRDVWLLGTKQHLQVVGYAPTPADYAELAVSVGAESRSDFNYTSRRMTMSEQSFSLNEDDLAELECLRECLDKPALHSFEWDSPDFYVWYHHGGAPRPAPLTEEALTAYLVDKKGYAASDAVAAARASSALTAVQLDWYRETIKQFHSHAARIDSNVFSTLKGSGGEIRARVVCDMAFNGRGSTPECTVRFEDDKAVCRFMGREWQVNEEKTISGETYLVMSPLYFPVAAEDFERAWGEVLKPFDKNSDPAYWRQVERMAEHVRSALPVADAAKIKHVIRSVLVEGVDMRNYSKDSPNGDGFPMTLGEVYCAAEAMTKLLNLPERQLQARAPEDGVRLDLV